MKIWFDIVNSPHVLFFKPILAELKSRDHSVHITAREYAQTLGLLDEFKIPHTVIGAHAGAKLRRKIADVFTRSLQLCAYARDMHFDLAVTFNSPSLSLAAKVLRIPSVVFMDYEHQPLNHLTFRLCDNVIVPRLFPDIALKKYGALAKAIKYDGYKEQVYLSDTSPSYDALSALSIDQKKVIVIARPPATMALYHRFENEFFYEVMQYFLNNEDVVVVALPRSQEQRDKIGRFDASNLIIPQKAIDGRALLHCSDIVLSAGGTMNREAAVLGVPAYTVFMGKIGAIDKHLIDMGRIVPLHTIDDLKKIRVMKNPRKTALNNDDLVRKLVNILIYHEKTTFFARYFYKPSA